MPDHTHQGWIDGHPEIGKMQKDIFDDIFDTTDDDATEDNDPAPNCSHTYRLHRQLQLPGSCIVVTSAKQIFLEIEF